MGAYGLLQFVKMSDMNPLLYDKMGFLLRTNLIENCDSYPVLFLSIPLGMPIAFYILGVSVRWFIRGIRFKMNSCVKRIF